ncbi:hypothetical protein KUTeg_021361 [Tegillarca granosa]|uniref:Ig-like domain-containing protein n=1 Tax=Tegillarca granosa TaxID=220873 RepID=A0ABQ9EAK6_TEGGR|nr:hypothetical protein KUTeg_021361 [Tegillarca granosa]
MCESRNYLDWNGKWNVLIYIWLMISILDIRSSSAEQVKWDAMCPSNCTCKLDNLKSNCFQRQMKIVNCSSTGLSNFPVNVSMETEVLILSSNNIKKLDINKKLKKLQYLDASNNKIHVIYHLEKLSRLKTLDLHKNSLIYIQNGCFSGMKYLSTLDLSDNNLHAIEKHAFGGLNGLQRLYLDSNKLYFLEKQWFIGMPSLRIFHFSRNFLPKIENNTFENMQNLIEIKLIHNKIQRIEKNAFHGLTELSMLDLSSNKISHISHQHLQQMKNLKVLRLDDNPIYKIHNGSFHSLNIKMLSLRYMPKLVIQKAFFNVPLLKTLYLHNNRLVAISEKIKRSLPSLRNLHIYNNPLRCDCNALWVKQELAKEQATNYVSILVDDSVLICDSPKEYSRMLLKQLPVSVFHSECAARTIPLFNSSYNINIGEEMRLECHSIGIPDPEIIWILPNGTTLQGSVKLDRYEVINNCTLAVRHIRTSDGGVFKCKANNTHGYDISNTSVTVSNMPIHIYTSSISADFVTIGWNGTSYWSMVSDYQIQCRDTHQSSLSYQIIHLRPFSNHYSYTFKNLKPQTTYEFCIDHHVAIYASGITRINSKLVAGVCTTFFMTCALCCGVAIAKKFKKRKDYLDPTAEEKGDFLPQIPLENLNNPPSTPLCSSRTALISAESNS